MSTLVTAVHVIVCLFLMLTVLLQSGKGGGMGAAFGGGNAATVFGGSGASGFLKRLTAIAGTLFMITSMVLAFLSSRNAGDALESFGREQEKEAVSKEQAAENARKAAAKAKKQQQQTPPQHPGSGSAGSASLPGVGSNAPGSAAAEQPDPVKSTGSGSAIKVESTGTGSNDAKGSAAPNNSSPNAPK
ncbi:MAG TPA: preprotein translocase subunit SecG [Kofleriaceae bacterium]|nr:preprotein translocase subunit SecG [Kofleriaceae bacterium]